MSRIFLGRSEIALSEADLRHALMLWLERCTMLGRSEYTLEKVTLCTDGEYAIRMVVKPPAAVKKAAEALKEKAD